MPEMSMIIARALGLFMSEGYPDYYGTYMGDLATTTTDEWDDVVCEPMSPINNKPHWMRTHAA